MTTRIQIINGVAYPTVVPLTPMEEHIIDSTIHVTQTDKDKWNNQITLGTVQPTIGFWFKVI